MVRGADVFVDGAIAMLAVYCCSLQHSLYRLYNFIKLRQFGAVIDSVFVSKEPFPKCLIVFA